MLILNINDTHITGKNPICRIDNLPDTQWNKWEEVVSIANKYNVPIVSAGDIFNVPLIANSILTKLGEILDKLINPFYFVFGNHDLMYHSFDMIDRVSLGVLWANNQKVKHISEFESDYGISWDFCDWNQELTETGSKYLLIHQAVVNNELIGGKTSWIKGDKEFSRNIEDDKSLQKYELILCGHWHNQYVINYGKTKIINSGPLIRRTIDEKRIPTIQLINIETKLLFTQRLSLQSTKPSEEVISDKHINIKIQNIESSILDFVNNLQSKDLKDHSFSSLLDIIMEILDNHELDNQMEIFLREIISRVIKIKLERENKKNE